MLRVKFRGIESNETASLLKGKKLYVEESSLPPLPEGEFYFFELEGFEVESEDGYFQGRLLWIERLPGEDLFHIVGTDGSEVLLPVVSEFIVNILKNEKKIIVRIPEGLM